MYQEAVDRLYAVADYWEGGEWRLGEGDRGVASGETELFPDIGSHLGGVLEY